MARRLNVLFILEPVKDWMYKPWVVDVQAAVGERHNFRLLDYTKPIPPQFQGVDVVIDHGGSGGTHAMADAAAGQVKLWQILGTGFDDFDVAYWKSNHIAVSNCPGQFSAVALAECAMMYMLMLVHKFHVSQEKLRAAVPGQPLHGELEYLKLGIVGFGASGRELAQRALPFGMKISAIDVREVGADERRQFGLQFVGKPADLDKVCAESDFLSLHLHLNAETHHIIDARRLALMKPTASVINVARGALVDEAALADALLNGRLGGAGLDVYGKEPPDPNAPIFALPNVVTTPHYSGGTTGTSRRRAQCAAENVERIAAGQEPLYRVD
jgi:phosphoglycerate dehydrogenase-like enzyme